MVRLSEINGGKAIAKMFAEYDVKFVFGMPGGQTLPIYDGLYDLQDKIRHIAVHDEVSGVYMADAYSRFSFKPGICDGTVGPGTTNMVSGVAEAFGNSIPIIAVTSDVNSKQAGKGISQECDQLAVLKSFTKASFRADYTNKIPEIVRKAFRISLTGRPGPVHIDFPDDILNGKDLSEKELYVEEDCKELPSRRAAPEDSKIIEAKDLIEKSATPVILAGGGAILSKAWDEVTELAELLAAPTVTTITGKGAIPENHPLSLGPIGRQGFREPANRAVEEADVLIAVGCKFAQVATDNWLLINHSTKIIQIDVDPAEIGRVYHAAVGIAGDAKITLRTIISALEMSKQKHDGKNSERLGKISQAKKEWRESVMPMMTSEDVPIKPQRVMKEVRDALPNDGVLVSDTSFTGAFTAAYFDTVMKGRTFYQQRGMAGIGGGLPAAIGAKAAVGERVVVGIGGDGSFGYHVSELETAKRNELPVVYVVFDNQSLGWIRYVQEKFYGNRVLSTKYSKINYARVAEAYDCFGRYIEKPSEIRPALDEAIRSGSPAVLDVRTDFAVLPPVVRRSEYSR